MIIELLFSLNEHKNTLCAETAEYPSMLARRALLQIFATKNTVFYNWTFLKHKRRFLQIQPCASVGSPALAL